MNSSQTYILGISMMLISSIAHGLINSWSSPLTGIGLLSNFVGLTIVITTALLESNWIEEADNG